MGSKKPATIDDLDRRLRTQNRLQVASVAAQAVNVALQAETVSALHGMNSALFGVQAKLQQQIDEQKRVALLDQLLFEVEQAAAGLEKLAADDPLAAAVTAERTRRGFGAVTARDFVRIESKRAWQSAAEVVVRVSGVAARGEVLQALEVLDKRQEWLDRLPELQAAHAANVAERQAIDATQTALASARAWLPASTPPRVGFAISLLTSVLLVPAALWLLGMTTVVLVDTGQIPLERKALLAASLVVVAVLCAIFYAAERHRVACKARDVLKDRLAVCERSQSSVREAISECESFLDGPQGQRAEEIIRAHPLLA